MAQVKSADYPISSVTRALRILKLFDQDNRQMSLTEISQKAGVNKSSVLRVLDSLEVEGFVRRSADTKKYMLGVELFRLGSSGYQFCDFKDMAQPIIKKVVDEVGLMAHLGVLDDDKIMVISKIWPRNSIDAMAMVSVVGGIVPPHCTGVGKVLLAFSDAAVRDSVLKTCAFEAYTPKTITSRELLEKELEKVRARGYATNNGEHEPYIRCTTYPVFNARGNLLAALSLTGLGQIVVDMDPRVIHDGLRAVTNELREESSRYGL